MAELKSRAQHLEPVLKLGKSGITDGFKESLRRSLKDHALLKIKFLDFKDQRHELAEQLALECGCHLVAVVGHVAVFYLAPSRDSDLPE